MIVTEIRKIGKGQRYYLFIDDAERAVIEAEILARHKLRTGDEIDEERLNQILLENGDYSAFDRALTYLEKNIKTEKGIREYLRQKGYLPESIEKAVAKLNEYGYINDELFAESFIRTYGNKKGKKKLKYELLAKGVSEGIIEEKLEELVAEEDEFCSCQKLLEKYIKNKPIDLKTKQKVYAHLAGKGFSSSVISRALREVLCELE